MNCLQLNPIKSEVIQFSDTKRRDKVDAVTSVLVLKVVIQPVSSIRSLGVTLDQKLSFDQHVNNTCKSCYYHIRALRHIRDSLPHEVNTVLACSVIGSRNYCNALLNGTSKSNLNKLQRVQNTLARVVLCQRKYEHMTPAKTNYIGYRCNIVSHSNCICSFFNRKNTSQPAYRRDLVPDYEPVRTL